MCRPSRDASWILESTKVKREMRKVKDRLAVRYAAALTSSVVHRALIERGYHQGFVDGAEMAHQLINQQEQRDKES